MVKIRLTLKGKKNQPTYRVVVMDSRKKRDGKYIEDLGYFNPQLKPQKFVIDKQKYEAWIKKGARPSESILKLIEGKYEFVKYKGKKVEEEKAEAESVNVDEKEKEVKTESIKE